MQTYEALVLIANRLSSPLLSAQPYIGNVCEVVLELKKRLASPEIDSAVNDFYAQHDKRIFPKILSWKNTDTASRRLSDTLPHRNPLAFSFSSINSDTSTVPALLLTQSGDHNESGSQDNHSKNAKPF